MTTPEGISISTWRDLISDEMRKWGEAWADVVSSAGSEHFDASFEQGWGGGQLGGPGGAPFTAWTERRVYFPVSYDGAEWCASVSRNPDGVPTEHLV